MFGAFLELGVWNLELWKSFPVSRYSFATFPPQERIFAFVPAASASLMSPFRL